MIMLTIKTLRMNFLGAGEVAQGSRTLALLPENLGSAPSTHTADLLSCPRFEGTSHIPVTIQAVKTLVQINKAVKNEFSCVSKCRL